MSPKPRQGRTTPASVPDVPRRRAAWLVPAAAVVLLLGVLAVVVQERSNAEIAASPSPTIIVGTAGGVVISQGEPSAAPVAESSSPSAAPTEAPVAMPSPAATPEPTAAAVVADATPAPPQPTAAPAATPAPEDTAVTLAVAGPEDAVGAFYAHVVAGSFDEAYSLWSDRMRAAYSRQENLDQRFDETASIEFQQLFVAERAGTTATVQADFTETYDSGSSRQFVGYWRLVQVDGRWLLDEPSY